MLSEIFKITNMAAPWGQFNYSVTWPGHGSVSSNRWRLVEWAFKTGANCVAFAYQERTWTIDAGLYYQHGAARIAEMFDHMPMVDAVAFETRTQAEKFVDSAERHIMWTRLSRKEIA